jgi:hypothetical protein
LVDWWIRNDFVIRKKFWTKQLYQSDAIQTGCMKVYTFSCSADSTGMIHISMVVLQISTDIAKDEPGLCSETCLTAHDGNQVIDVKFQKGSDVEEDDDPVAITFPALKAECEVSCVSMLLH